MKVLEFESPEKQYASHEVQKQLRDSGWFELSANFACWIGIAGLILLIAQVGRAQTAPGGRGGFLPGARPFNPFTNAPPGNSPRGNNYYDDEDDDDLDGADDAPMPSSRAKPPGLKSYSAGGTQSSGPDPIITDKGVSVGGQSANGVVARNKTAPLKIDDETAEGSKDIITDFNFPDADILDIAKTLGKLAGKNFILDKDVKGKITIISNSPITVGEAWKVFLTALDINGFALIPSGKYLRIARQRDARDKQLKTYTGEFSPDTDALITRVFPLKYISAEEVARTFRSFMPANARIIPYEQTNTVIVTDTGSNISKLAKMLEILDVEGYDAGIEVVSVKFASASELSKLIDGLIPGTSTGSPGGPGGAPRFGDGGGGRFSSRRTKEGGIINTIIADERTNTLIVHANSRGADQVRELVAKLDLKNPTTTGGGKVHVVYLQFADSEQIANTLNNFSSQSGSKSASPSGAAGGSGTGANPIANSLFEGSIKIAPDKATNSLVITASPADFVTVQRVINRLDIPRDQVYVEVVIMEIGINRNFEYSANIAGPSSGLGSIVNTDLSAFLSSPLSSTGALFGFKGGGTTNINVGGQNVEVGNIQGLVRAIQGHTNSNILATPQIIALDNTEANFESSEKIPVTSGTTLAATGMSQQMITKEDVSLSIKIKPQINKVTNFVKLDISTKLSEIQNNLVPKSLQGQAIGKLERTATTTVIVGDSDTVVLGGLIRTTSSETVSKIPILGDIPLLGWLFRAKTSQALKSNLVILMTPHIVRQYEKIRSILDRKLKERDDFLEANSGGDDPQRWKRDEVIRSLPDIKALQENHPPTTITIDEDEPIKKPATVVKPAETNSSVEVKPNNGKPNDEKSGGIKQEIPPPPTAPAPGQEPGSAAPATLPFMTPTSVTAPPLVPNLDSHGAGS